MERLDATDELHVTDSASLTTRTYTSIRHLQSASVLADATRSAEEAWGGIGPTWDEKGLVKIVANATATLYCGVAFLEASINELYLDAIERERFEVKHQWTRLTARHPSLLSDLAIIWPQVERRTPLVEKYQRAALAAGARLDGAHVTDVATMVRLRNWLTHAKPETHVVSSDIPDLPITKRPLLEELAQRFAFNRKWGDAGRTMDAALASPCATWALHSALGFADRFWASLGIDPPYEHVRPAGQ